MYYPEEIVEEVRQRNNIVDVVGSYVPLRKRGTNYVGLCPFHNERTPSFSVNSNMQIYKCFGCGKGGNVITFVMEYENFSFAEALKLLADKVNINLPEAEMSEEDKKRRGEREQLLEINREAAKYFYFLLRQEQGRHAGEYLLERGLSEDTIKRFGIGYGGKSSGGLYSYLKQKGYRDEQLKMSGLVTIEERGAYDKFWNRVIFPIMDRNGKVIAFGGRIMGDPGKSPKYLNSPETRVFEKGRNLYALNIARQSREDYMLLCEGYMDVISLHQAGFTNAVASLGTALTEHQAKLIARYVKKVVITYDSDGAGMKAALRAIPILKAADISVKVLSMKPYKDPDDFIRGLGAQEYQQRIDNAANAFYFELDNVMDTLDMSDPEQKTRFAHTVAARLAAIRDDIERDSYLGAVSKRYDIDYENLRRLMNRLGRDAYLAEANKERKEQEKLGSLASRRGADGGIRRSQRLLLTRLAGDTSSFERIKDIVSADDFTEELYHRVAQMVFEQYEKEGGVFPARIIGCFDDGGEQDEVAGMFSETVYEELDETQQRKAFADTVIRVKENSLKLQLKAAAEKGDGGLMSNLTKEQLNLPNLHNYLIAG